MKNYRLVLFCALATLAGCADLTETIVHIDAPPERIAQSTDLEITILTESGDTRYMSLTRIAERPAADFPFHITVVPDNDDASRTFVLIAGLYRGDELLVEQEASYGFVNGESQHVDFVFAGEDD